MNGSGEAPKRAPAPSPLRLLAATVAIVFGAEALLTLANGHLRPLSQVPEALRDAALLVAVVLPLLYLVWARSLRRVLAEHTRTQAELEARTSRDRTTQLLNRSAFEAAVERLLSRAAGEPTRSVLVVLDVRRFHQINEALGHKHGDQLLQQIAERLKGEVSNMRLAARLGVDVFGVLLGGILPELASQAAHRVHEVMERPFTLMDGPIEVEGHLGVAVFPEHGRDAAELGAHAELALRQAKEQGERSLAYTGTDEASTARRVRLFGLLRLALERQELTLTYQPKLTTETGVIASAEALLSWRHAELGPISPFEFITIAEQTSLIKPLTAWVLDEAIRQLSVWEQEGIELKVAVNLSARNLSDETLPDYVSALLSRWEVRPERLMVEITESAVLLDPARAGTVLERLVKLGVSLSLDDFGTGYSSLTYLRTLPASELKIDRSFVLDADTNTSNAAIIRGIVRLAHDLELQVVAEGVETEAIARLLRELGCDVLQGYFLSRPVPAAAFAEFFRKHSASQIQTMLVENPTTTPASLTRISVRPLQAPPLRDSLKALRAIGAATRSDAPGR
jgi:diguanylate cyclase